ncbi:hypothetical protein [Mycolicibacterium sp.]|uniref:hypothetical protein n=1 Tax=Mycolicibacterium sp. TaxID=2320850 RepID=UPI003D123266
MRLSSAFFAEDTEWVDGKLNIIGGGFGSTCVPPGTSEIAVHIVLIFDSVGEDIGKADVLHIELHGPDGERLPGFRSHSYVVPGNIQLVSTGLIALSINPAGGRHSCVLWTERHGNCQVAMPLDVNVVDPATVRH